MKNIEIPQPADRNRIYRALEILPGLTSWSILVLPVLLSIFVPLLAAYYILAYLMLWFVKAIGQVVRIIQADRRMRLHQRLDWQLMMHELDHPDELSDYALRNKILWHERNVAAVSQRQDIKSTEMFHVLMIAMYKETRDVLKPTLDAILKSPFPMKQVILVIAHEERGGVATDELAKDIVKEYGHHFYHAMEVQHPKDIPGEIIGKGGNITFAGRELQKYLEQAKIDPRNVLVTTLDADNQVHPAYLASSAYIFTVCPDRIHTSFQPILIYTSNIWDAPAPMRVIATSNSFFTMMQSLRPHLLRNFASHAQGMQALIETDFWSTRTIVEDGHQFWRTYFRFDGDHEVQPIFVPIYQDAVLASTFTRTLKAQFIQLRRWAWGASDIAYVGYYGFFKKNKVNRFDMMAKFTRLVINHVSWATDSLIIAFAALLPVYISPKARTSYLLNELPQIASSLQRWALIGLVVMMFFSFKSLPPKPKRYKRHRTLFMLIQWVYLPVVGIAYHSFSVLYSQTRLMFGNYIGKFDATEKATRKD